MKVKSPTWKRRALRAAAVPVGLVVLLLAIRLVWGWEADRRLAATRERLVSAGVRLNAEVRQAAPEKNAVEAMKDAIAAIRLSSDDKRLLMEGDTDASSVDICWTEAHRPDVKRALGAQAAAFKHLREMAARPEAYWEESAGAGVLAPTHPVYQFRFLANLLVDDAVVAHDEKRDGEALEDLCLVLELARVEDADTSEIGHLVACAVRSLAAVAVERLELDLTLQEADGSAAAARRMVSLLAKVPQGDAQALAYENAIGRMDAIPEAGIQPFWRWWFAPLWEDETARIKANMAQGVAAVRAGNWQASHRLTPWHRETESMLQASALGISSDAGYTEQYIRLHFRTCADCAAAELLLAARLYAMEQGHVPATREALVPRYLAALPVDPFAGDGRPMQYRVDADGVTVWSVYENGTDEGGHVLLDGGIRVRRYGGSSDPRRNPPDLIYGAAWRNAPTGHVPVGVGAFAAPATRP